MFENMIVRAISKEMDSHRDALINRVREELKAEVKAQCKELVGALFTSKATREREWGGFFAGWEDADSVIGIMKRNISDMALEDFKEQYITHVGRHIQGEAFIDAIVERIQKKQLK
jgi:hypothetical protein